MRRRAPQPDPAAEVATRRGAAYARAGAPLLAPPGRLGAVLAGPPGFPRLAEDLEWLFPGTLLPAVNAVRGALLPPPGAGLEEEHGRLLAGAGPLAAPPYESVQREPQGLVMGESTADVLRTYARWGVAPASGGHQLPDHLGMEFQFMALLAVEEGRAHAARQAGRALLLREEQRRFLSHHVAAWLPAFARRVQGEARHPFFPAYLDLLDRFVQLDLRQFATDSTRAAPAPRLAA